MNTLLPAIAAALLAAPAWAQDADAPAEPATAPEAEEAAPETGEASPEAGEAAGTQPAGEEGAGGAAEPAGEDADGGPVVVDIEEGSVLDDQTFEGEDDDFIPSEEIPIDQPIPFPTDI